MTEHQLRLLTSITQQTLNGARALSDLAEHLRRREVLLDSIGEPSPEQIEESATCSFVRAYCERASGKMYAAFDRDLLPATEAALGRAK